MILTYKYRIKDRSARKTLRQHAYAVNQVWNYCVAHQRKIEACYRSGARARQWPSNYTLHELTKGTSKELGIHSGSIHEVCRQFVTSRRQARHAPRFRKSGGTRKSLGWVPFRSTDFQHQRNCVTYLGRRFRFFGAKSRPLPAVVKGGHFVEDARGRWYACVRVEIASDRPRGVGNIGIDLGLKSILSCSDGATTPAPQYYRAFEKRLAVAQRAGNNRRAQAIHAKIANRRRDLLHKATAKIARENALIAVGNVSSSTLAKTRMAKSVIDASWAMFRSQLRYKASRHGAVYLDVDEKFTSQTCSRCGVIPASSPKGMGALGIRRWECSDCGAVHDRDVNAAINILNVALSAQRRGDESREVA